MGRGNGQRSFYPELRRRGFPAIHFRAPNYIKKRKDMGIRSAIKDAKAAPQKAVGIALVALSVALVALFFAWSKSNG
jgi:hypothetical protein